MKKILFISSRPLYPIIGGDQIRTVQQLCLLEKDFIVDVLYLTNEIENEDFYSKHSNVRNIYSFHIRKYMNYIQTLRFLFNRLPLQVNYYLNRRVRNFINTIISNYDAVFCNNIRTAEYGINAPIIRYLDFVDAISMNYDKARKEAKGLKKIIYELDYRRCKEYEKKCLYNFDSCAVISDIDNQYITKWQK
ncbi:MAG: hypothetical protein HDS35_10935 [Bacteroides sp.]|nr:hypothetical protein [Bacteroides sp.]